MRITCDDGAQGIGYTYTIGTGGSSVVALLRDHLAPRLIGRDADEIEAIWKDLFFHTHATAVGAITSLALAAIDTALWDLRCRRAGAAAVEGGRRRAAAGCRSTRPKAAGCIIRRSSWSTRRWRRRRRAFAARRSRSASRRSPRTSRGWRRCARRSATRSRSWSTRTRRSPWPRRAGARTRIAPLGARVARGAAAGGGPRRPRRARARRRRCRSPSASRSTTRRISASISSARACSIVQVDCARIGGITPWLKVAHLAEDVQRRRCARTS